MVVRGAGLAIRGGRPVSSPLAAPAWPRPRQATADGLRDLYLSGKWSFNLADQADGFASDFAAYHGARFGIFMANGTVTLECALMALGIGDGDEVIVPASTWVATAMAVRFAGARPVFVDVEPTTLCMDPGKIEAAITGRTRALLPVHMYGSTTNMDEVLAIAKRHGLRVVEDCAQAHGTHWAGKGIGSLGDIGSFSFQHNKLMTSGEGGICITSDPVLADRLYRLKHIGYQPGEPMGGFTERPPADFLCHNYRATEFQALILRDQLEGLGALVLTYQSRLEQLRANLADVPGVRLQARGTRADPQSCYKIAFVFDEQPLVDVPLAAIRRAVAAEGLTLDDSYGAVYRHTLFNMPAESYSLPEEGCPVAEGTIGARTTTIHHTFLGEQPSTIDTIAEILAKVTRHADVLSDT